MNNLRPRNNPSGKIWLHSQQPSFLLPILQIGFLFPTQSDRRYNQMSRGQSISRVWLPVDKHLVMPIKEVWGTVIENRPVRDTDDSTVQVKPFLSAWQASNFEYICLFIEETAWIPITLKIHDRSHLKEQTNRLKFKDEIQTNSIHTGIQDTAGVA